MITSRSSSLPKRYRAIVMLFAAALVFLQAPARHGVLTAQSDPNTLVDPALFKELRYRSIGPFRGGRVTAVAGHRRQPSTFYMGATGGGVWKTTDSGKLWTPMSDGYFGTGSIGAIDVAESDPNIVYVGTGSAAIRSNVIQGRGVYKSADAGRTWTFVGLRDVGQIGALKVHPTDSNIAFVAALGQPFGSNPERGVFRTRDGGRSWQKVLFINDRTGAVSLAMNPSNPREIYAGAWRGERKPWTIISGGPASECGVYKTTDGGDTWTHLTNGLPTTLIGKVGVDVSPSNPKRVYVILEAPGTAAGVYRSDDAGVTFRQVNATPGLIARPFYYTYIDADPKDENTVYVNNLSFYKSTDGGRTFGTIPTPHGDNHGMWINPDNPQIFIQSNDGGANVTLDGGQTWSTQYNQPTIEFYAVAVDNQFPYRLYGAQQDSSSTIIVPGLPTSAAPVDDPIQLWHQGPGCETGPVMPKIDDPNIVYGACKGEFYRMNLAAGQEQPRWVHPQNRYGQAARDIRYRFQRVSPLELSPHDPRVIYYCSHVVHRTTDEGVTWEVISPDLTANEPDKQGISGEPITRDITGEEVYSAIYAFRESPLEQGVLWAGANDGPVHVSRDSGKTWRKVTPPDLPPGGRVQNIEISPFRKGGAYIAVYRYLLNDWQPYIYATNDYGATWKRLTDGRNGIPPDFPTRVVREDPDREGLLYAGTEFGMFVSFDGGGHWQPFQQNLPATPITDIRVHRQDLVLSTMGRGFWIMDNVTPLHQIGAALAANPELSRGGWHTGLATPRTAYRMRYAMMGGRPDEPEYPAPGAQIDYYLAADVTGDMTLEILDAGGKVLRTFTGSSGVRSGSPPTTGGQKGLEITEDQDMPRRSTAAPPRLLKTAGMHRLVWDLHAGSAVSVETMRGGGPLAVPGKYQARLTIDGETETKPFEVRIDPRVAADGVTQVDLQEQYELTIRLQQVLADARATAVRIAAARERLASRAGNEAAVRELAALEAKLVTASGAYQQPMLIDQLSAIQRMVTAADQRVGRSAFEYLEELTRALAAIQAEAKKLGG